MHTTARETTILQVQQSQKLSQTANCAHPDWGEYSK